MSSLLLFLIFAMCAEVCSAGEQSRAEPDYPRIARFYGAGIWSPKVKKERLDFVSRYDLLVGGVNPALTEQIAYMRRKNPHLKILFYYSLREQKAGRPEIKDSWWLRTERGELDETWPGCYRINLTLPEVVDFVVEDLIQKFEQGKNCWDGIFFDCFNLRLSARKGYDADGDGKADDINTLNRRWEAGMRRIVAEVFRRTHGKLLYMVNSWYLADGPYEYLNGCLGEGVIDRIYWGKSSVTWEENLQLYFRWMKLGRKPCLVSLVNGSGKIHDPWQRKRMSREALEADMEEARRDEKRMRFGLTTTLMGDGYFAYNAYTSRGDWWYKEYDAPLGYPRGDARRFPDGTWRREYDGGLVIVNPTKSAVEVSLDGNYRDASSDAVVRSITVPAMDGRILIRTP